VSWEDAFVSLAHEFMRVRDETWEGSAGRSEGLAFLGGQDLGDEEVYLLRKLASLLGSLGCEHEARLGAVAGERALRSTLGVGLENPVKDLSSARILLVLGADPATEDPMLMRRLVQAREEGTRLVVVDTHLTRTGAMADEFLALRPGSFLAFLGALLHQVLEQESYDAEFLLRETDAGFLVNPDFSFAGGLFSGVRESPEGEMEYDRSTWGYQRNNAGEPLKVGDLNAEGTVFAHLRRQYAGYDLRTAESLTGLRSEQIERVAQWLGSVRPGAVLFGRGLTHSSQGVQQVRGAALMQLLLGGREIFPLLPGAGTRAGLECGGLWEHLPGGAPPPGQWQVNLGEYRRIQGEVAHDRLTHLLRVWFGEEVSLEEAYRFLPRVARGARYTISDLMDGIWEGQIRTLLCLGHDLVGGPLGGAPARSTLRHLELLVVVDLFETQTADFWSLEDNPERISTEVWLLPGASFLEKEVGFRGKHSGHRTAALVSPPGQALPEVEILSRLARHLQILAASQKRPRDRALTQVRWPDPKEEPEAVRQEIEALFGGASSSQAPFERARLLVDDLLDGPFPVHYEPAEGPLENALHPDQGISPLVAGGLPEAVWTPDLEARFPFLVATGELPDAWGTGRISERLTGWEQGGKDPRVEISRSLARRLGVTSGERVLLSTPRGALELVAMQTDRLRPLYCAGSFVEVLWLPVGFRGLGGVTLDILDPTSGTPDSGVCRGQLQRIGAVGEDLGRFSGGIREGVGVERKDALEAVSDPEMISQEASGVAWELEDLPSSEEAEAVDSCSQVSKEGGERP
jgi:anaerobic selenocysteine-containing dehydrogenase